MKPIDKLDVRLLCEFDRNLLLRHHKCPHCEKGYLDLYYTDCSSDPNGYKIAICNSCNVFGSFDTNVLICLTSVRSYRCHCGNADFGFACTCLWELKHPGDIEYTCEFCGLYQASEPMCNKCVIDD